jgi:hypothetical protein
MQQRRQRAVMRVLGADEQRVAQVLADRNEYRPLLVSLLARAREHGGKLPISEHEQIDLRDTMRQVLEHMTPGDRQFVEQGLYSQSVRAREVSLRRVLYASMARLQQAA